jgi:hypothetical protein
METTIETEHKVVAVIEFEPEYYGDVVVVHRVVTAAEIEVPGLFLENNGYGKDARITGLEYPEAPDTVTCRHCDAEVLKEHAWRSDLYDTPWDKKPEDAWYCSGYCYDAQQGRIYSKDFNYFECDVCGRNICEQNPRNGWHTQVRGLEEEQVCLKCYEEHIIEHGIDRGSFEDNKINGMFLETSEIEAAGYKQVEGFVYKQIQGEEDAEPYCKKALELIDVGYTVLTDYERMAIGGLEGYVTMYARKLPVGCIRCTDSRGIEDCDACGVRG